MIKVHDSVASLSWSGAGNLEPITVTLHMKQETPCCSVQGTVHTQMITNSFTLGGNLSWPVSQLARSYEVGENQRTQRKPHVQNKSMYVQCMNDLYMLPWILLLV